MKKLIKYFLPVSFFLISCAPNVSVAKDTKDKTNVEAKKTEEFIVKSEDASYYSDKKEVKGFIAYPEKAGKYPALILIHEWWGLNDNIKENAKKFAKLGYVALTADLYGVPGTTDMAKARELAGAVRNNTEEALKNLKNAVTFLKARSDVNPEIYEVFNKKLLEFDETTIKVIFVFFYFSKISAN